MKPSYILLNVGLFVAWIRVRREERVTVVTTRRAGIFAGPALSLIPWFRREKFGTLSACSLACSSSKACCFSFSSMRLKDMPVEEREDTALDKVEALQHTRPNLNIPYWFFSSSHLAVKYLPGVCIQLLSLFALKRGQVLLQSLQEAAGGLRGKGEEKGRKKKFSDQINFSIILFSLSFSLIYMKDTFPPTHT